MGKLTLDRILQSQGFGTRRACRALIREGAVALGGVAVDNFDAPLEAEGLSFEVHGESWMYHRQLYLALHKPPGYECSRKPSHHPGIMSLLPAQYGWRETQSVGRLDHDTTGLLLISDDGAFIHAQTSPRRQVPKTFIARTRGPVTPQLVAQLLGGVQLVDEAAPIAVQACRPLAERSLEIVLDQGKYHQVKRMLVAAGNHCVALHRSAIGRLDLAALGLREGARRFVPLVREAGVRAGARLDQNLVAMLDQGPGACGHERHARLRVLHLTRNGDDHDDPLARPWPRPTSVRGRRAARRGAS